MRLCFIADPRSIHTQRWVRWFAEDHEVVLIATTEDPALADVTALTLPGAPSGIGLRLLRSVREVRAAVQRLQPDVLHAHFINEPGWLGAASGRHPLVITAWGSDLYRAPLESRMARFLNPWSLRRADHVTCDSADQARVIRSWGVAPERVSVIGWGVDRGEFHPGISGRGVRERLRLPLDAPVVLSPRQWLANSNVDTIVEAHALLPSDVHLVLKRLPRFEHGAAAKAVEAAIAASPARDRIRVVAELPADELASLYAAGDVVVSLCVTDGTPVSLLEAMALGLPVVALENASIVEWVSEPGGYLVRSLGAEEVAAALGGFVSDRAARERAAAHNVSVVGQHADRATDMARMAAIYGRLAATPP